ncbi:ABC transporter substrate binding protein [Paenibacillus popilliae]|nr:ABC transporter substrate binding protein [Paenibacillus popilliae]
MRELERTEGHGQNEDGTKMVKIGMEQYANHPSLDMARQGFLQALKFAGYKENVILQVDFHNAQSDMNHNSIPKAG